MITLTKKIISKYSNQSSKHLPLFFLGGIPEKKLTHAINTYATEVHPDDVLALLDSSVFGSSKEGALLTETALYANESFNDPKQINLSDITTVTISKRVFLINGIEFFTSVLPKKSNLLFSELLLELSNSLNEKGSQGEIEERHSDSQQNSQKNNPSPELKSEIICPEILPETKTKRYPFCCETILEQAIKCKHCREILNKTNPNFESEYPTGESSAEQPFKKHEALPLSNSSSNFETNVETSPNNLEKKKLQKKVLSLLKQKTEPNNPSVLQTSQTLNSTHTQQSTTAPSVKPQENTPETKECPSCKELILKNATKCKHCHDSLQGAFWGCVSSIIGLIILIIIIISFINAFCLF